MARTIFTNGLVFDGSGSPAAPGEVIIEADRVVSVTPGWRGEHRSGEHRSGEHRSGEHRSEISTAASGSST